MRLASDVYVCIRFSFDIFHIKEENERETENRCTTPGKIYRSCQLHEIATSLDGIDSSNRERSEYTFILQSTISDLLDHNQMNAGSLINFMVPKKNTNILPQLFLGYGYLTPTAPRRYLLLTIVHSLFSSFQHVYAIGLRKFDIAKGSEVQACMCSAFSWIVP